MDSSNSSVHACGEQRMSPICWPFSRWPPASLVRCTNFHQTGHCTGVRHDGHGPSCNGRGVSVRCIFVFFRLIALPLSAWATPAAAVSSLVLFFPDRTPANIRCYVYVGLVPWIPRGGRGGAHCVCSAHIDTLVISPQGVKSALLHIDVVLFT
ncbi:hypothetical protein HYPSUDRAFT_585583 [Hypholoma sublateritium FD-334 SS-4]|uniref:Uncharacterized protein n=1 Tax=Hypholoma sublateritium (strain FD-334 SS-4) TaxID=945553 RepID=A0A0D2L849_HYPSF|nr:hypothetical protein HYPSUDRAFT_585583 [Hypholoma sublateritium FD-334 SS-4]